MKKAKLLVAALLLSTQFTMTFAGDIPQRFAALQKAAQEKRLDIVGLQIIIIPTAGDLLANKFVVASLKAGYDSAPSQRISQLLLEQSSLRLAITSEDDGIGAATLERALLSLNGKALAPHQLVFVGDKAYEESLASAAAAVGLKLVYVACP